MNIIVRSIGMPRIKQVAWRIYLTATATAIATFLLSFRFAHHIFRSDTTLDDLLLALIVAIVAIGLLYQRELRKKDVEAQKLRTFRATMVTVQDLLGNFLGNMQYMRSEAESCMPDDTLQLFDQLLEDVATHMHSLGNVETVTEKKMAIGMGIDYPPPRPNDKSSRVQ
jgi:hypothetical protein